MKRIFFLYLLIAFTCAISAQEHCEVTFHIQKFPSYTPKNATIYLAGSLNGWKPRSKHCFTAGNNYSLTLKGKVGKKIQFKFTLGSWDKVEKGRDQQEIGNRTFTFSKKQKKVYFIIENWRQKQSEFKNTITGNVKTINSFVIPSLRTQRRIWIYLPADYEKSKKRYPVFYMHDGQNLFNEKSSFGGEWRIDETLEKLQKQKKIDGMIVVGIDNGGKSRTNEYSPWSGNVYGAQGKVYCQFLVQTLKPYIDRKYRTLPGRKFTGIAGSSLGGLISLYAILHYPQIFSKAGVFSPTFGTSKKKLISWIQNRNIKQPIKIYMDMGDQEYQTKGQSVKDTKAVYLLLLKHKKITTHFWVEKGAYHNEIAWGRRFPGALLWLLER